MKHILDVSNGRQSPELIGVGCEVKVWIWGQITDYYIWCGQSPILLQYNFSYSILSYTRGMLHIGHEIMSRITHISPYHIKTWLLTPKWIECPVLNISVCVFGMNLLKFELSQLICIWIGILTPDRVWCQASTLAELWVSQILCLQSH